MLSVMGHEYDEKSCLYCFINQNGLIVEAKPYLAHMSKPQCVVRLCPCCKPTSRLRLKNMTEDQATIFEIMAR